jgi:hypothetical protein
MEMGILICHFQLFVSKFLWDQGVGTRTKRGVQKEFDVFSPSIMELLVSK